jgi:hypothetical protein|tara:strand:+ start:76 stop:303 length:228 start_codon:yes stop_codon:yes gene_type:complete
MKNETHNGWTNYATWRVNLECFDGMDSCEGMSADACQELVEDHVTEQSDFLARDYALAFLADVNWYEIAEHLTEE